MKNKGQMKFLIVAEVCVYWSLLNVFYLLGFEFGVEGTAQEHFPASKKGPVGPFVLIL